MPPVLLWRGYRNGSRRRENDPFFRRAQPVTSFPFYNILAYTDNGFVIINILASEEFSQIPLFVLIYILGYTCKQIYFFGILARIVTY